MNSVERAQRDMLFALVMEASKESGGEDDIEAINKKYDLSIPNRLLSASLEAWEDAGLLSVSRHSDGIAAFVRQSRYGSALSALMGLVGANTLTFDWHLREIVHDSENADDWPGLAGWKQIKLDSSKRHEATYFDPSDFSSDDFETGPTHVPVPSHDSAAWTGIEHRLERSPQVVETIRIKIHEIDGLVDKAGMTNAERQKAKAISEALVKLVESPEPEWRAIVELLTSRPLTALLNLTAILQIAVRLIVGG